MAIIRKKFRHRSSSCIYQHICGYDNSLSKLDFQGPGLKVKVDMFEIFSIMLDLILLNLII